MNNINLYYCKDGRIRIYDKDEQKVISYPKYLMETKLNRKLKPFEQVHHIDGNPLNNDISNLEIRSLGEHQKEHSQKYFDKQMICSVCQKEFIWTAKQQRYYFSNMSRKNLKRSEKICCSKHCAGLSAHI